MLWVQCLSVSDADLAAVCMCQSLQVPGTVSPAHALLSWRSSCSWSQTWNKCTGSRPGKSSFFLHGRTGHNWGRALGFPGLRRVCGRMKTLGWCVQLLSLGPHLTVTSRTSWVSCPVIPSCRFGYVRKVMFTCAGNGVVMQLPRVPPLCSALPALQICTCRDLGHGVAANPGPSTG